MMLSSNPEEGEENVSPSLCLPTGATKGEAVVGNLEQYQKNVMTRTCTFTWSTLALVTLTVDCIMVTVMVVAHHLVWGWPNPCSAAGLASAVPPHKISSARVRGDPEGLWLCGPK